MSFILRTPKTTAIKKIVNYFSQCVQKFTVKIIDGVLRVDRMDRLLGADVARKDTCAKVRADLAVAARFRPILDNNQIENSALNH